MDPCKSKFFCGSQVSEEVVPTCTHPASGDKAQKLICRPCWRLARRPRRETGKPTEGIAKVIGHDTRPRILRELGERPFDAFRPWLTIALLLGRVQGASTIYASSIGHRSTPVVASSPCAPDGQAAKANVDPVCRQRRRRRIISVRKITQVAPQRVSYSVSTTRFCPEYPRATLQHVKVDPLSQGRPTWPLLLVVVQQGCCGSQTGNEATPKPWPAPSAPA